MGALSRCRLAACFLVLILAQIRSTFSGDWPMLGRDSTRNAVTSETGAPTNWSVEQRGREGRLVRGARGVRWSAPLGWSTFSSPVVSSGLVWIGTNYSGPESGGDRRQGFLKCFRAADGKLLYEMKSSALMDFERETVHGGISSSPLIEGDHLWVVTNRNEVVSLDIGPLLRGDGQPRQLWKLDMVAELGIFQRSAMMGPARNCSIGPSWNNRIFVTTNNGANRLQPGPIRVPSPDAPSIVCLDKNSGKVLWKDSTPGVNILTTQYASPTVAEIAGQTQVIVPQGDGWVRSFDPETGKLFWEFDVNFKDSTHGPFGNGTKNDLLANAVVYEDRVYICSGQEAMHGAGKGRLVCIDATKRGDISSELAVDREKKLLPRRRDTAVIPANGERTVSNPNSGLVWEFVKNGDQFEDQMHRSMSNVVIHKGLLIAADFSGLVHCFDAKTGKRHWAHDTLAAIWASPLIAGDKVYVPDEDGNISVFQLSADPMCAEPIATVEHGTNIYSGPVYIDGMLYVASQTTLHAIDAAQARRANEQTAYWPQWRGEKRDNRSSDTGLLTSWPADGPPLVWRVDGLGDGIASLAIADGRIFTTTSYGNSEYVVALDEGTGELLWIERVGGTVTESPLMRWLSQRTPTVDGDRVYAFTKEGWLCCLRASTGRAIWKVNYPSEFGTKQPTFGYCDRPLVDGDKLICVPGGPQATIVALDKGSGQVVWKTLVEGRERAAYGSTIVLQTEGLRQYVAVLQKGLASFAADDGRLLWRHEAAKHVVGNSQTPLVLPDGLLLPYGYAGAVERIRLTRQGDGVTSELVYGVRERLDPFEDSTMIVGDRFYGFGPLPLCLAVDDGSKVWKPVRPSGFTTTKAAATYADGRLYVRWSSGPVILVDTSAQEYTEKGRLNLLEPRNSVGATFPVVAGGHLFVRDNDRLYCYDVSQQSTGSKPPATKLVALTAPRDVGPKPPEGQRIPDAIFVPTPGDVVQRMLALAKIGKDDLIYDLGSGDGRLLIEAAKRYDCRAVGIEIKRELCELSRNRALQAEVHNLVTIREGDLFESNFDDATVVAIYLFPGLLERLKPKFDQLKPGTRIISHQFAIPGAAPDATETVQSSETGDRHTIYLWTTPLKK